VIKRHFIVLLAGLLLLSTAVPGLAQDGDDVPLAAEVNGEPITLAELELELQVLEQNVGQLAEDRTAWQAEVLDNMIDVLLIEQYAAENEIEITEEEVEAEIAELNRLAAENEMTVAEVFGYPEEMLTEKIREILIVQAVNEAITAEVPTTAPQVHARHILVRDEETAQAILDQLNSGADFGELALNYSKDRSTATSGGDLGWISPGELLQPEVEDIIFSMPVNSRYPEPVPSKLGYHVLEVLERAEQRLLDAQQLVARQQAVFADWLAEQRENAEIIRYIEVETTDEP
jgi:peptidyl-prolyl cis-trans isomerase C